MFGHFIESYEELKKQVEERWGRRGYKQNPGLVQRFLWKRKWPFCGNNVVLIAVNLHNVTHVRLAVGSQIAAEMREAMYSQLELTGCAGVAPNKLLAKLVSGVFKPNQQTVLLPESCQDLIHSLNHIKEIPGKMKALEDCVSALR